LADRITVSATHAPSKRLYEVDSDGMEIDDWETLGFLCLFLGLGLRSFLSGTDTHKTVISWV
jgi:hypothetical protein